MSKQSERYRNMQPNSHRFICLALRCRRMGFCSRFPNVGWLLQEFGSWKDNLVAAYRHVHGHYDCHRFCGCSGSFLCCRSGGEVGTVRQIAPNKHLTGRKLAIVCGRQGLLTGSHLEKKASVLPNQQAWAQKECAFISEGLRRVAARQQRRRSISL